MRRHFRGRRWQGLSLFEMTICRQRQAVLQIHNLARTMNIGMTGQNLFDQSGPGSRHTDDQYRPGCLIRGLLHLFSQLGCVTGDPVCNQRPLFGEIEFR